MKPISYIFMVILISASVISIMMTSCSGQKEITTHRFEIVELPEYYEGKGAIVPASTEILFPKQDCKRVDLTIEQIKSAESILKEDIGNWLRKWMRSGRLHLPSNIKTEEDTANYLNNSFDKKVIKEYYRQYVGYRDKNNDLLVDIRLFKYDTRDSRNEFKNWQDEIVYHIVSPPDGYIMAYTVNLTKREVVFYN
jgi:hypothetical protein